MFIHTQKFVNVSLTLFPSDTLIFCAIIRIIKYVRGEYVTWYDNSSSSSLHSCWARSCGSWGSQSRQSVDCLNYFILSIKPEPPDLSCCRSCSRIPPTCPCRLHYLGRSWCRSGCTEHWLCCNTHWCWSNLWQCDLTLHFTTLEALDLDSASSSHSHCYRCRHRSLCWSSQADQHIWSCCCSSG